jgi:quercetin dioxygenase-like cupin family protein
MTRLMLLTLPLLLGSAAPAIAKTSPAALQWGAAPPSLPTGAEMAVVSGDPGKKGMFAVQLKMPAGYAVPAHHHPTAETVKVLSGTLNYGMGDKLDKAKAMPLAAGKSVAMKAMMNHWVYADAPATIEVSGMGPLQITYVDPKDDPRTK